MHCILYCLCCLSFSISPKYIKLSSKQLHSNTFTWNDLRSVIMFGSLFTQHTTKTHLDNIWIIRKCINCSRASGTPLMISLCENEINLDILFCGGSDGLNYLQNFWSAILNENEIEKQPSSSSSKCKEIMKNYRLVS